MAELLTLAELSARLGVSAVTIYNWMSDKYKQPCPSTMIDGIRMFDEAAVREWQDKKRRYRQRSEAR